MKISFRSLLFTLLAVSCAVPTLNVRQAQAVSVDSISLKDASFYDVGVVRDDSGDRYDYPQFKAGSTSTSAPLTYGRATTIGVDASFSVTPRNATNSVKVRASGNGFKWPAKKCTARDGNLKYSYELSDLQTPSKVRKANLIINWEYSTDDGVTWNSAGNSNNTTYVTWSGVPALHTVLEISCYNADGYVAPRDIFNGIWREFGTRAVTRQDGTPMSYFGFNQSALSYTADHLVRYADGNCDAWSNLFSRTLSLQSVPSREIILKPKEVEGVANEDLFIKMNPAPAQNNPNPIFIFNYHRMVGSNATRINGGLYDPSFGKSYETDTPIKDWEQATSLSRVYLNSNGDYVGVKKDPDSEVYPIY